MRQAVKRAVRDTDLSARFTADEKRRVELAMAKTGKNLTDFVRDAVIGSADMVLADDAVSAFAGAIGVIGVPGDFGRRADETYAELLLQKHASSKRRTR
jgi:hypothetical protein